MARSLQRSRGSSIENSITNICLTISPLSPKITSRYQTVESGSNCWLRVKVRDPKSDPKSDLRYKLALKTLNAAQPSHVMDPELIGYTVWPESPGQQSLTPFRELIQVYHSRHRRQQTGCKPSWMITHLTTINRPLISDEILRSIWPQKYLTPGEFLSLCRISFPDLWFLIRTWQWPAREPWTDWIFWNQF